jgi:hypothetical protein
MIYSLNERINKLEQLIERMTISNGWFNVKTR